MRASCRCLSLPSGCQLVRTVSPASTCLPVPGLVVCFSTPPSPDTSTELDIRELPTKRLGGAATVPPSCSGVAVIARSGQQQHQQQAAAAHRTAFF
jgi:hypothetical protein